MRIAYRSHGHYHTPDFFVLSAENAAWVEWKTEAQLQKLSEKYPTRYLQAADGSWRCPPGSAYAEPRGLKYGVFCIDPRKGGFWKIRFSITPLKPLPANKRLSQKLHFWRHIDIMSLSMSQNAILRASKE